MTKRIVQLFFTLLRSSEFSCCSVIPVWMWVFIVYSVRVLTRFKHYL